MSYSLVAASGTLLTHVSPAVCTSLALRINDTLSVKATTKIPSKDASTRYLSQDPPSDLPNNVVEVTVPKSCGTGRTISLFACPNLLESALRNPDGCLFATTAFCTAFSSTTLCIRSSFRPSEGPHLGKTSATSCVSKISSHSTSSLAGSSTLLNLNDLSLALLSRLLVGNHLSSSSKIVGAVLPLVTDHLELPWLLPLPLLLLASERRRLVSEHERRNVGEEGGKRAREGEKPGLGRGIVGNGAAGRWGKSSSYGREERARRRFEGVRWRERDGGVASLARTMEWWCASVS